MNTTTTPKGLAMRPRISREWATPVTIGVFALMAVTGGLMFFHANTHLQEEVHAWVGWMLVAAVALHVVSNLTAFKRYFQRLGRPTLIVGAALVALAASFVPLAGGGGDARPVPQIAIEALTRAPIGQVAPLFGQTGEQARSALALQGIVVPDDASSLAQAIGNDRERTAQALQHLAAGRTGP